MTNQEVIKMLDEAFVEQTKIGATVFGESVEKILCGVAEKAKDQDYAGAIKDLDKLDELVSSYTKLMKETLGHRLIIGLQFKM